MLLRVVVAIILAAVLVPCVRAIPPLVHEGVVEAPIEEVWAVFSTGEGFRKLGPAKADVDLRPGGLIRSHYDAAGSLDDDGAIHNEIMAFEPPRMLAMRVARPPATFPFKEAVKGMWSVITLTDLGDGRTHVRIAGMGYTDDPESQAMRQFFDQGNAWTMRTLQSQFSKEGEAPPRPDEAHADRPLAPIVAEVVINSPRDDVWRAYTTSEGWRGFVNREARIGSAPGEPFEIYFDAQGEQGLRGSEGCTVLSLIPGEMFSHTWNAPPQFPDARRERTWVVVEFEAVSGGATRILLRHLGFEEQAASRPEKAEEWQQVRRYFARAWPHVLEAMKDHLEPDAPDAR